MCLTRPWRQGASSTSMSENSAQYDVIKMSFDVTLRRQHPETHGLSRAKITIDVLSPKHYSRSSCGAHLKTCECSESVMKSYQRPIGAMYRVAIVLSPSMLFPSILYSLFAYLSPTGRFPNSKRCREIKIKIPTFETNV